MEQSQINFRKGDGLPLVDIQRDFAPATKLAVAGADDIVPVLNNWLAAALKNKIPVYASRDWHPKRHPSFKEEGGLWPPHRIADSEGTKFHPELQLPESTVTIPKGVRFDQDQKSVFDQTEFAVQLQPDNIERLRVGDHALEVCVLASVMDGLREDLP